MVVIGRAEMLYLGVERERTDDGWRRNGNKQKEKKSGEKVRDDS